MELKQTKKFVIIPAKLASQGDAWRVDDGRTHLLCGLLQGDLALLIPESRNGGVPSFHKLTIAVNYVHSNIANYLSRGC